MRGQTSDVVCRATVNCTGGPGDDLGDTTTRDCCVNNPRGLAYVTNINEGTCIPCVGECRHSYSILLHNLSTHIGKESSVAWSSCVYYLSS